MDEANAGTNPKSKLNEDEEESSSNSEGEEAPAQVPEAAP